MKAAKRLFNGARLQELMDERGISMSELAAKVRANKGNISRWINGENQPRPRKIKLLCTVFRVTRESLLLPEGVGLNGRN